MREQGYGLVARRFHAREIGEKKHGNYDYAEGCNVVPQARHAGEGRHCVLHVESRVQQRGKPQPYGQRARASENGAEQHEQEVFAYHGKIRITESFKTCDLSAFFVEQARHVGIHNEHSYEQKEYYEHYSYKPYFFRVRHHCV